MPPSYRLGRFLKRAVIVIASLMAQPVGAVERPLTLQGDPADAARRVAAAHPF